MISKTWTWQPKDWRDQPLHILMGCWPVFLLGIITDSPLVAAITTVFTIGYLARREYDQHEQSGNFVNLDLVFGIIGTLVGNIALFLL